MANKGFIILAAGRGIRMDSDLPKPLIKIGQKSMLQMVADAACAAGADKRIVVFSDDRVGEYAVNLGLTAVKQSEPIGTADALKVALPASLDCDNIIVACTDIPMVTDKIFEDLYRQHMEHSHYLTVLTAKVKNPFGYGRVIKAGNRVLKIVEELEATAQERKVELINSGIYCINRQGLENYVSKIERSPVKGEYYLTDLVQIVSEAGEKVGQMNCEYKYLAGINTAEQLAELKEVWSL